MWVGFEQEGKTVRWTVFPTAGESLPLREYAFIRKKQKSIFSVSHSQKNSQPNGLAFVFGIGIDVGGIRTGRENSGKMPSV